MADPQSDKPKKIILDLDWLPEPLPGPHTVTFLPSGRRVTVEHGQSVFEAAQSLGIPVPTDCGGKGTCGLCRVRVAGEARPPSLIEKRHIPVKDLAANVRLACRLRVEEDVAVTILPPQRRRS